MAVNNHLIIFTRNPQLGKIKTRLAKSVGDNNALKVYLHLLEHTAFISSNLSVDKHIYYDSYIEIFTNDANCLNPVSTGNGNDDDGVNCPDYSAPYPPSGLWAVTLQPGQYYIAVGGFSGATGNYEISVSLTGTRNNNNLADNFIRSTWSQQQEKMADSGMDQSLIDNYTNVALSPERYSRNSVSREIPEECGTFSTYAVYNAQNNTLIAETENLTYTHSGLTNGTEYCYYVKFLHPFHHVY